MLFRFKFFVALGSVFTFSSSVLANPAHISSNLLDNSPFHYCPIHQLVGDNDGDGDIDVLDSNPSFDGDNQDVLNSRTVALLIDDFYAGYPACSYYYYDGDSINAISVSTYLTYCDQDVEPIPGNSSGYRLRPEVQFSPWVHLGFRAHAQDFSVRGYVSLSSSDNFRCFLNEGTFRGFVSMKDFSNVDFEIPSVIFVSCNCYRIRNSRSDIIFYVYENVVCRVRNAGEFLQHFGLRSSDSIRHRPGRIRVRNASGRSYRVTVRRDTRTTFSSCPVEAFRR